MRTEAGFSRRRRDLLGALPVGLAAGVAASLGAASSAALAGPAVGSGGAPARSPVAAAPHHGPAYAGLRRWGSGPFRRFGFLVYEATLWAGDDPQRPPLALRLDYRRTLEGKAIAAASVSEMNRILGERSVPPAWGEAMRRVFPDVRPGDHLVGLYRDETAHFYQSERLLGSIDIPGFAPAFFSIWLDVRTSAPELRQALLTRREA